MNADDLIARPCPRRFSEMRPGVVPGTRLCADCDTFVHDLSGLSAREARALVESRKGDLCVRVLHDLEGRVHFRDTVPAARLARRVMALALVAAAPLLLEACGGAAPTFEEGAYAVEPAPEDGADATESAGGEQSDR